MEPVFGKCDTFETLRLILWASLASFYLPWWFTLTQLPQWRKMFIYLWQKWHIESCHVRSVIIFCLWSRELPHNREMFQPSSAAPTESGDGCKIDSTTYGYLAQACSTGAFFGENLSTDFILRWFKGLRLNGWQGGAGPSSSKMKVPTDFQVPRRASAKIGTYGPAAREGRGGRWELKAGV